MPPAGTLQRRIPSRDRHIGRAGRGREGGVGDGLDGAGAGTEPERAGYASGSPERMPRSQSRASTNTSSA
jgi:hypothetical protein